jgi:MazG family protein
MHSPHSDPAPPPAPSSSTPLRPRPAGLDEALFPPAAWEKDPLDLSLREIIARLRAPDGCPWDREQTHKSLIRNLREEAAEAMDAMDAGDTANLREELGDVLLQVVLHSQIAAEAGDFTLDEVEREIREKLVRRHPHVFGEDVTEDTAGVLKRWEEIKKQEKAGRPASAVPPSVLDGVPRHLPTLSRAQMIQKKAAATGWEWRSIERALDKLEEEVAELREAHEQGADAAKLQDELGDVLFVAVGFARRTGLDAEAAMEHAIAKYRRRFAHMEALARKEERTLESLSGEEYYAYWLDAKKAGH